MELTFVNQYSNEPPKRRRLAKACEACRIRKKRCMHYSRAGLAEQYRQSFSHSPTQSTDACNGCCDDEDVAGLSGSQQQSRKNGRHVGDLSPESTLLKHRAPIGHASHTRITDGLGIWVDRREWEELRKYHDDATRSKRGSCSSTKPHSTALEPLIDIFFDKIHPIFPLLDECEFRKGYAEGLVSEELIHAVCLVAAKDAAAQPHLRLAESEATVSLRQFCKTLHTSIKSTLNGPCRVDKSTLICVLALTSMHAEGIDGAEEASIMLSQAVHHAQTLGIHLGQQGTSATSTELAAKKLFWCLYSLDRFNGAANGRAVFMADIDIAATPFEPGESGFPAFEAWLRITNLLNSVINLYRPSGPKSTTGWEGPYPGLEEILDDVGAWELSSSLLATIHLFYLSVAMLSHRARGVKEVPRAVASQVRQRLCALEVIRLLEPAASAKTLHPLPIVPYAASLSMSVTYQSLRQSQLSHQQADACSDFRSCCHILQRLRHTWCSADLMATLGKKVLEEIDRTADLTSFRIKRARRDPGVGVASGESKDLIPPPTACRGALSNIPSASENANMHALAEACATEAAPEPVADTVQNGVDIFDNMDDVFGTFMDPNYSLNLEEMSFVDDLVWRPDVNADLLPSLSPHT